MSPVGEGIAFSVAWVFTRATSQAAPFSYRTFSFRCSSEAETDEGPHGSPVPLSPKHHVYEPTGEHDDRSLNQVLHHYGCFRDDRQSLTPTNASVSLFQYKALTP